MADPYQPPLLQDEVNIPAPGDDVDSIGNDSNGISLQPTFGDKEETDSPQPIQNNSQITPQQPQQPFQNQESTGAFHALTDEPEDRSQISKSNNQDFNRYNTPTGTNTSINSNNNNNYNTNNFDSNMRNENIKDNSMEYDDSSYLLQHPKSTRDLFGCSHLLVVPLFFTMSFFTYFDRGTLSASLDNIQTQLLNDSSFESGALASAYLFGYCLSCPFFALLGSYYPPIRMSAAGMFVWSLGCAFTGVFSNFYLLLGSRLLTGIGEASFLSFSSTIIDTIVPTESRSRWLGFFYMAIPLGYAFGDGIGGVIADQDISPFVKNDGTNESWRLTFLIEFVVMLPLIVMMLCMKSPPNMLVIKELKQGNDEGEPDLTDDIWHEKFLRIITNKTWLAATAGYATQTFVTGTFAVEAITYLKKVYGQSSAEAGTFIGVITFTTGVLGSIFGGYVLDKIKSQTTITDESLIALDIDKNENERIRQSMTNDDSNRSRIETAKVDNIVTDYEYVGPAFTLLACLSVVSFPAAFIIFLFHNQYLFYSLLGFAEFFIFASQGPVNNAVLWCSLYRDRPLAAAINTLAIHLFGDALAPLLIGWIVDYQENHEGKSESDAYNFALGIASWWLMLSVISFFLGRYTLDSLKQFMQHHENLAHEAKQKQLLES